MPITEAPKQVQEIPQLEVLDILKTNGYRLTGPKESDGFLKWGIYSRDIPVGSVLYKSNEPDFGLDKGTISVNYQAGMNVTLSSDEITEIEINPNQIESALEFERFLIQQGRAYRSNGSHNLRRIVNFFRKDGLLERMDVIDKELKEISRAIS